MKDLKETKDRTGEAPEAGFSLTELMVVMVIIGILVALVALPKFGAVTTKARATEAKIMLQQLYALEQAHYFETSFYTDDLKKLGFEQSTLVTEGGTAYYQISVERVEDAGYTAIATAAVDYDKEGTFMAGDWDARGGGPEGRRDARAWGQR